MYIIVILLLVIGYIYLDQKRKYESFWKHIYALPGPAYYPIIGNTQGYSKSADEAFAMTLRRTKEFGPLCRIWSFTFAAVISTSPEDIEVVLSSTKHISKGRIYDYLHQWLGTGLLTSTGSKWQQRRKILTPAFHFSILQDFVNVFNRETDILVNNLKAICDRPYIDVSAPITEFALNSIGETSLGVDMNLQPKRKQYKNAIYTFGHGFIYRIMRPWFRIPFIYNLTNFSKEINHALEILHSFSTGIINDRKKAFAEAGEMGLQRKKGIALLDLLLKTKKETGAIDDEGIREEVDTFMFEGHDTTTVGFSYLLLVLANEPKWQEEIRREIEAVLGDNQNHPTFQQLGEMKLMERCIKESLRLYPSVPGIQRMAEESFKTPSGYYIPKGTNIIIHIFSLHRSEKIWENPEKFDPDRFLPENTAKRHPFSFIPFSAGPRNCIGQRFAMLEMKTALCGILRNFILDPVGKPEDIVFKADLVLRTDNEVRVRFIPRKKE